MNSKQNEFKRSSEIRGNILVVDDTPANLQLLSKILIDNGYKVRPAPNAIIALQSVQVSPPDLILLDVMMPDLNGFETCRRLKAQEISQEIPVIFMTALTDTEDKVKGFEAGGVDYVTKPFNPQELLARVQTHLELKFKEEMITRQKNQYRELLHVLSHDLSNPLTGLHMMLEVAEKRGASWLFDRRQDMHSSINHATEVINLVRKIRALEEGKLKISLRSTNLAKAIEQSVMILEQKFSLKKIELILHLEEKLFVQIEKTSFINSVLNNIFTNAIKFSFPGSRVVVKTQANEEKAVLSVKDFGMGISGELLSKIFEPSQSTTRPGTNGETGTGFGMPLMKKFVQAYGGTIEILSKEKTDISNDHGTTVILNLMKGELPD